MFYCCLRYTILLIENHILWFVSITALYIGVTVFLLRLIISTILKITIIATIRLD